MIELKCTKKAVEWARGKMAASQPELSTKLMDDWLALHAEVERLEKENTRLIEDVKNAFRKCRG